MIADNKKAKTWGVRNAKMSPARTNQGSAIVMVGYMESSNYLRTFIKGELASIVRYYGLKCGYYYVTIIKKQMNNIEMTK